MRRPLLRTRFLPLVGTVLLGVMLGLAAASWAYTSSANNPSVPPGASGGADSPATLSAAPEPSYVDIRLACVGDILIHNTVYRAAQTSDGYDFKPQFRHVKPYLEAADLTIANLETTLAGASQGYSGYPQFNSPDEIAEALYDAGVDVLTTANNHCMDQGRAGFFRTLDVARDSGLAVIGTRKTAEEPAYLVREIKGVNVGILNFGYGSRSGSNAYINGLPLPADMAGLLNFLDYGRLDEEFGQLQSVVAAMRQDGAQLLVACMHWGNEYQRYSQVLQQKTARELAALGVDIIFGSHPHVVQEAAWIEAPDKTRKTLVYYSLGNFISDQRLETVNDIYTEQGLIADVTVRCYADGTHEIQQAAYLPTWVNKKSNGSLRFYEVIPVPDALNDFSAFPALVEADRARITFCQKSVDELMTGLLRADQP